MPAEVSQLLLGADHLCSVSQGSGGDDVDDAMSGDVDDLLREYLKIGRASDGGVACWSSFASAWKSLSFATLHHVVPAYVEPPDFLQLWFEVILDHLFVDPPSDLPPESALGMPSEAAWKMGLIFALCTTYETQLLQPKECVRVSPAYWNKLVLVLQELEPHTKEPGRVFRSALREKAFCFCAAGGPVGFPRAIRRPSKLSHDPALVFPPSTTSAEEVLRECEDKSGNEAPLSFDLAEVIDYNAIKEAATAYEGALTTDGASASSTSTAFGKRTTTNTTLRKNDVASRKTLMSSSSSSLFHKKRPPSSSSSSLFHKKRSPPKKSQLQVPKSKAILLDHSSITALRKSLQDVEALLLDGTGTAARSNADMTVSQRRGTESMASFLKRGAQARVARSMASQPPPPIAKKSPVPQVGSTVYAPKEGPTIPLNPAVATAAVSSQLGQVVVSATKTPALETSNSKRTEHSIAATGSTTARVPSVGTILQPIEPKPTACRPVAVVAPVQIRNPTQVEPEKKRVLPREEGDKAQRKAFLLSNPPPPPMSISTITTKTTTIATALHHRNPRSSSPPPAIVSTGANTSASARENAKAKGGTAVSKDDNNILEDTPSISKKRPRTFKLRIRKSAVKKKKKPDADMEVVLI